MGQCFVCADEEQTNGCRISAEIGIQAGAKGPGSLRVEMLDALYSMKQRHIKDNIQVGAYT